MWTRSELRRERRPLISSVSIVLPAFLYSINRALTISVSHTRRSREEALLGKIQMGVKGGAYYQKTVCLHTAVLKLKRASCTRNLISTAVSFFSIVARGLFERYKSWLFVPSKNICQRSYSIQQQQSRSSPYQRIIDLIYLKLLLSSRGFLTNDPSIGKSSKVILEEWHDSIIFQYRYLHSLLR